MSAHGLHTLHTLMAGSRMDQFYPGYLLDLLGAHKLLDFAFAGGASSQSP